MVFVKFTEGVLESLDLVRDRLPQATVRCHKRLISDGVEKF